jgi:hypothetical protein
MTQDQAEAVLVRVGPFWDGIEGRVPVPLAAATLGFGLVDATADEITVSFEATPAFTNPMGVVLGAFQAAMLYDTVGPALLATLGPGEFIETIPRRHRLNDEVTYDGGRDSRRPMPRSAAAALGGRWCDGARPCAWRADNWQRAWSAEPHRPAVRQR